MARIRYLKPEFWEDREVSKLNFEERLCFQGLWNFADKEGRLRDDPEWLKVKIFPYDKVDIEKCLERLARNKTTGQPFIHRYEVGGQRYIQILQWHKHQKPHHTEQVSTIPCCPTVQEPLENGVTTPSSQVKGNGKGELKGQRERIPLDCKLDLYKILKSLPLKTTDGLLTLFCSGLQARTRCGDPEKCKIWLKDLTMSAVGHKPENLYGYLKVSIDNFLAGNGWREK
jgi:hypothetical protein